jgi:hypothetical protein
MHESPLVTSRRAHQHTHDRALLQFALAAWVVLLALGLVLLL